MLLGAQSVRKELVHIQATEILYHEYSAQKDKAAEL